MQQEEEVFIHRMPGKDESHDDACVASFSAGRSARHRYISGFFWGGLAHVLTSNKFWREEEDMQLVVPRFGFWKEGSVCGK